MAWYLNRSLTTLRAEVNARWPHRDKTSDGTIGDAAHQATVSDHNPDSDGSVDAWDMDVDGVNAALVKQRFEQHEAALYWIHNRQIADRRYGWRREPYHGANPHDKHVHFNTRKSHEGSTRPWGIWPAVTDQEDEDDELTPGEKWVLHVVNYRIEGLKANRETINIPARPDLGTQYTAITETNRLAVALAKLTRLAGSDV